MPLACTPIAPITTSVSLRLPGGQPHAFPPSQTASRAGARFVGEVGIIVIGVLIALGAEQLVEAVINATKGVRRRTRSAMSWGSIWVASNRGRISMTASLGA